MKEEVWWVILIFIGILIGIGLNIALQHDTKLIESKQTQLFEEARNTKINAVILENKSLKQTLEFCQMDERFFRSAYVKSFYKDQVIADKLYRTEFVPNEVIKSYNCLDWSGKDLNKLKEEDVKEYDCIIQGGVKK